MHFAVGMGCGAVATGSACLLLRTRLRAWRWAPLVMTIGGFWALLPDMLRFFQEDFPNAPFVWLLGSSDIDRFLNQWGKLFFFHRPLDVQSHDFSLHGLVLILLFYKWDYCAFIVAGEA